MRKNFFLGIAIVWTLIVLVLCLVRLDGAPKVNVINFDKYIHSFFHFSFTTLWFLYFKLHFKGNSKLNPFLFSWFFSVFIGILIELLQKYCTVSRSGDVLDVCANVFGASLAIIFCYYLDRNNYLKLILK
ncbi:VanZ family protein [Flavobacterium sp. 7A]|uniref:VanZ family protein n=1 Tax=Flavobacterium sp. 7A TaxID=2940571 RepID=UPI0022273F1A|nr:VanZ family protein [Flavobacterium sp. 7A]MCW2117866.1 VanZ family protein [Flavobacterium sp. 7A]